MRDTFAAMGVVRRFAVAGLDEAARKTGRRRGLTAGAIDETGQVKAGARNWDHGGRLILTALTSGSARVFPAEQLRRFRIGHPAVLWTVAEGVCERLKAAEARIASAAHDNADRRLARLLYDLER